MLPLMSITFITVNIVVGLNVWKNYLIVSTFLQGKDNYTAPMGLLSLNGTYTGPGRYDGRCTNVNRPYLIFLF